LEHWDGTSIPQINDSPVYGMFVEGVAMRISSPRYPGIVLPLVAGGTAMAQAAHMPGHLQLARDFVVNTKPENNTHGVSYNLLMH